MSTVELQSQDHRALLDIIDILSSLGVIRCIDLPHIVMCSDPIRWQELCARSHFRFPRRGEISGVEVFIIPGPGRSQQELADLSQLHHEVDLVRPELSGIIEQVKSAMSLPKSMVFSNDGPRIELKGRNQPHLTSVYSVLSGGSQSVESAALVREMFYSYMAKSRSVILAVVSAQSDFVLQPITELSRKLDPRGIRTLGLITKHDTLAHGPDSEPSYTSLAQNRDVVFCLGWHCLRNRSYEIRNAWSTERGETEKRFFASRTRAHLEQSTVDIQAVRPRLSDVPKDLILQQLPSLM